MKSKLLLLASVLIFFASCGTKKYDQNLSKGLEEVKANYLASSIIAAKVSSVWHDAIYDHEDHTGKYCSDFNVALYRYHNSIEENGTISKLQNGKKELSEYAKLLKDAPKSRKDAYNDFIELVSNVNSLADMAIEPDGSLSSYSSQVRDLVSTIKKQITSFELKYSDIIVDLEDEQVKDEDDW